MKKKVLISILAILLILTLAGCVVAPELTDRYLAEETVYNYWQAIINRQYVLAKLYCVIGGILDRADATLFAAPVAYLFKVYLF